MKKLVIAEKKSVATSIAAVLGANATNGGYYESDKYIVSWCVGHLLTSAEPEAYDKKYASPWKVDVLPILPDVYKYVPIESSKRQLNILQGLLGRADVATIVNACDAGREGELIFRLVYDYCNCKKPLERLWISSLEESAISEGFKNLRAGSSYDNLHKAALCRQKADWIVGMNLSRLFSCVYYGRVNIGRVQTPTLAMIVERELKITNFVKEPFYTVEITGCGFTSARERLSDKSRAESIQQNCEGATATINSVTKQEKSESPLKLYDLTTLQRDANRLFGYTAAETLKITQNLYEQQLLTYPRTDSRYITEDMAAGIPPLVGQMVEILKSLNMSIHIEQNGINTRQITNNAKISDHHAIIPTPTTASVSVSIASLPKETKDILLMVCVRLVSAVSQKHTYAETVITTECKEELFTAKGKNVIIDGWKAVEHTFS
ncbi:MAG: DNA topoisomerase, partial [Defluviitaleaceae bacterium]|nr:DNA topoisomerase [Defluviitaleaceae bacterium]